MNGVQVALSGHSVLEEFGIGFCCVDHVDEVIESTFKIEDKRFKRMEGS